MKISTQKRFPITATRTRKKAQTQIPTTSTTSATLLLTLRRSWLRISRNSKKLRFQSLEYRRSNNLLWRSTMKRNWRNWSGPSFIKRWTSLSKAQLWLTLKRLNTSTITLMGARHWWRSSVGIQTLQKAQSWLKTSNLIISPLTSQISQLFNQYARIPFTI
jgi:hypothetical protein